MQLRRRETAVIRPSKPPFEDDHVLSLSHLDTDRNLLVTLRYLRIYPNKNPHQSDSDPFQIIAAALSTALVPYYPLTGTLRRRDSDGRLELLCRAGHGLPVVNAAAEFPLTAAEMTDPPLADQLAPDPDPNEDPIRPMMLQITRFSCGGFVLGAAVHHAICDGFGATLFFGAVAELARGSGRIGLDPAWYRSELLGPRDPPRVEYPIGEVLGLDKGFSPYAGSGSGKRVVKEYLNVKEEWLGRVKGLLFEQSGFKFTTFEALAAFIWTARIKAEKMDANERVTFAYSISIRNIVNPPLPAGYWGNSCVPMFVHLAAAEVAEQPMWKTAAAIKRSKQHATAEYVASYVDFQELHYKEGINGGRRVSGFTDWRHLGHSAVDFGWGGPTAVVPLSTRLLGSVEPCFLLPGEEGKVKVLVHLEEGLVLPFRGEMDMLTTLENGVLCAM